MEIRMKRNDCEAVLHLNRTFLPRRRTGRGFLTGTVFLDAALLIAAFVLATAPFVLQPGIEIDLPSAGQTDGIQYNDSVLRITRNGTFFFNDEPLDPAGLKTALRDGAKTNPGAALILEADRSATQATVSTVYEAAAEAGFRKLFIATRTPESASP
jgi:biopolymer transport protein ExbD